MRGRVSTALAAALVVAMAGCSSPAPSSPSTGGSQPIDARVESNGFVLRVALPSATYDSADPIPVETTITWVGPAPIGRIWGSGSGPAFFAFKEVGGAGREMSGPVTADCAVHDFPAGVPVAIPLRKGASWTDKDPNAAFYRAWSQDPVLRLPPGTWQLRVSAGGLLAECSAAAPPFEAALPPIELVIR
jgi:hypothetical protein